MLDAPTNPTVSVFSLIYAATVLGVISPLFRVYIRINANEHAPFTTTLTDFNQ